MAVVAYATWTALPTEEDSDDDLPLLVEALAERDVQCQPVPWDGRVDWAGFDLVVVRSCWDYDRRRAEFLDWARAVGEQTRLRNPVAVLERNTDKTYLRDLARRGVPVIPTVWFAPGDDVLFEVDWTEVVVKPAVSASARDTMRTGDRAEAAAHVEAVLATGKTAMVQPYLDMVETEGETSLMFFGGQSRPVFSHAVRRAPMLVPEAQLGYGESREPDQDQLQLARRVLDAEPSSADLLYARVDLLRSERGEPVLIELELTEPYLFLKFDDEAPGRLAHAIAGLFER